MIFMFVCLFVSIVATIVSIMDFKIGNKKSAWLGAIVAVINFAAFLNVALNLK